MGGDVETHDSRHVAALAGQEGGSSGMAVPRSAHSSAGSCVSGYVKPSEDDAASGIRRTRSESSFVANKLNGVMASLDDERSALRRERGRRLRCAGSSSMSSAVSTRSSSCWSQAVRSTVLDLELQLERERREAAEEELTALRAQLANAKNGGC